MNSAVKVMVLNDYMLCPRCKFQRFSLSNGQEIIFVKCNAKVSHWGWHVKNMTYLSDEILDWNSLMQSMRHSNILCLSCGKCSLSLQFATP